MRRAFITTGSMLISTLIWGGLIAVDSPFEGGSGALVATPLVVLTATAVVGVLLSGGRWARNLGMVSIVSGIMFGLSVEVSALWWIASGFTLIALAGLVGSGIDAVVGRLPSAGGPPWQAVALPLGAVGWIAALAAAQPRGVSAADWVVAAVMASMAYWYMRALPGALWVVRLGIPTLTLITIGVVSWPGWLLPVGAGLCLAALAWTVAARIAVNPLIERGSAVPIPPELAPQDVLDAAGLDDRGRPRSP